MQSELLRVISLRAYPVKESGISPLAAFTNELDVETIGFLRLSKEVVSRQSVRTTPANPNVEVYHVLSWN